MIEHKLIAGDLHGATRMMRVQLLVTVIFASFLLSVRVLAQSPSCPPPPKPDGPDDYQRRADRCEGRISLRRDGIGGTPSLDAFVITTLSDQDLKKKSIAIRLPGYDALHRPEVSLRAFNKQYLLDNLNLPQTSRGDFTFRWSTEVLQNLDVRAAELRLLASYNADGGEYYVPVLLIAENSSKLRRAGHYIYTYYNPRSTLYTAFFIYDMDGQLVHSQRLNRSQPVKGINLLWNGISRRHRAVCQSGTYKAVLQYRFPSPDSNETQELATTFEHAPAFLGVAGCRNE